MYHQGVKLTGSRSGTTKVWPDLDPNLLKRLSLSADDKVVGWLFCTGNTQTGTWANSEDQIEDSKMSKQQATRQYIHENILT